MSRAFNYGVIKAAGAFTRPANTTAYASGDLVANHVTAGSVTPVSLTLDRTTAASTFGIKGVKLKKSGTGVSNASFRVHLYSASPAVTNGDNEAWLSDNAATYLGSVDVTVDKAFSDGAVGVGTATEIIGVSSSAGIIYALLEARGAYTPGNAETFTLSIFGNQH
jgi:hypothetical protein